MKIQNKKNPSHKKRLILILVLIIIAVLSTGAYAIHIINKPKTNNTANTVNYKKPSTVQVSNGNQIKSNEASGTSSDTPAAPTPQANSSQSIVQVFVTSAIQTSSTYNIRSLISTVTATGTCTLTLTQGDSKYAQTSNVQAEATTSTCEGFNVPLDQLSPGTWQLVLDFSNSTLTGSTTSTITVT